MLCVLGDRQVTYLPPMRLLLRLRVVIRRVRDSGQGVPHLSHRRKLGGSLIYLIWYCALPSKGGKRGGYI